MLEVARLRRGYVPLLGGRRRPPGPPSWRSRFPSRRDNDLREPAFGAGADLGQTSSVTRDDFTAQLLRLGYPHSIVCWDGPGIGECYAVEHGPAGWSVYYSERGDRVDERSFDTESDALRYALGWIIDHNACPAPTCRYAGDGRRALSLNASPVEAVAGVVLTS
jgi:hypothetical protein